VNKFHFRLGPLLARAVREYQTAKRRCGESSESIGALESLLRAARTGPYSTRSGHRMMVWTLVEAERRSEGLRAQARHCAASLGVLYERRREAEFDFQRALAARDALERLRARRFAMFTMVEAARDEWDDEEERLLRPGGGATRSETLRGDRSD